MKFSRTAIFIDATFLPRCRRAVVNKRFLIRLTPLARPPKGGTTGQDRRS
jgi:hypothetical protein